MTDEQIKLILEIISTFAVVAASIVAIYGKIELAEEVLALFYEVRDVISAVRSPLGFASEGSTRKPQGEETPAQKEARDSAFVVFERFHNRQEVFNKLYSKRYQFMTRFGTDKAEPFENLRGIETKIIVSARALARIWERRTDDEESNKRRLKHEAVIWEESEDDEINTSLKKVISDIEAICKPIIMGK
jgi:hypothetical protein